MYVTSKRPLAANERIALEKASKPFTGKRGRSFAMWALFAAFLFLVFTTPIAATIGYIFSDRMALVFGTAWAVMFTGLTIYVIASGKLNMGARYTSLLDQNDACVLKVQADEVVVILDQKGTEIATCYKVKEDEFVVLPVLKATSGRLPNSQFEIVAGADGQTLVGVFCEGNVLKPTSSITLEKAFALFLQNKFEGARTTAITIRATPSSLEHEIRNLFLGWQGKTGLKFSGSTRFQGGAWQSR